MFASSEFPELETLIQRRFSQQGDVEYAFEAVGRSNGESLSRKVFDILCLCFSSVMDRIGRHTKSLGGLKENT